MESTQEMSGQFVYRELCIVCKNKQNQLLMIPLFSQEIKIAYHMHVQHLMEFTI